MYIGNKEIEKIEGTKVFFKDGTTRKCTKQELKCLVTPQEADLTTLRENMLNEVVPAILKVFEDYNVRKGDIQSILNEVVGSYNNTFNIAVGKAFGTFEEGKHSAYFPDDIRISEIKKFI